MFFNGSITYVLGERTHECFFKSLLTMESFFQEMMVTMRLQKTSLVENISKDF